MAEVRQLIILELMRRLDAQFPCEIKRGFGGLNVASFPAIYIFEDDETVQDAVSDVMVKAHHRGILNRTLPLIIEYFGRGKNLSDLYETGNEMLADVARAVELDKYFSDTNGKNLVNGYYQKSNTILPVRDGVIEVVVQYDFLYPARHLGF